MPYYFPVSVLVGNNPPIDPQPEPQPDLGALFDMAIFKQEQKPTNPSKGDAWQKLEDGLTVGLFQFHTNPDRWLQIFSESVDLRYSDNSIAVNNYGYETPNRDYPPDTRVRLSIKNGKYLFFGYGILWTNDEYVKADYEDANKWMIIRHDSVLPDYSISLSSELMWESKFNETNGGIFIRFDFEFEMNVTDIFNSISFCVYDPYSYTSNDDYQSNLTVNMFYKEIIDA